MAPLEAIADRYEILDSRPGGMGVVYAVRDLETGERYAAKTIRLDLRADRRVRKRFDREVRTWIGLGRHPNLVSALFVLEDEGVPYLFLEYMEGPTLARVLERDGPLNLLQAVDLAGQFARGLAFAHEKPMGEGRPGIVHRDVKPENLFLTPDRVGKVSDLGIAKVLSADLAATAEGIGLGTPFYVSPEQLKGSRHIDGRADVYSFGVVLYEMLTGRVPLKADSLESQIYNILRTEPKPPSEWNGKVTAALSDLVLRCLEKSPDDRPAGFRPVIESLTELLAGADLAAADPPASTCVSCGYASRTTPSSCPVCKGEMGPAMPFVGRLVPEEIRERTPLPARLLISDRTVFPSVARVGDRVTVTISILNQGSEAARGVEVPHLVPDADVFRREPEEEIWHGEVPPAGPGRPFELAYSLIPLREGTFRFPPAELRYPADGEGLVSVEGGSEVRLSVRANYKLPLVGRERQWREIREHLDRPEPALALVTSEPGGGRSRFVDDFAEELRGKGRLVLKGKALERGGEPLKVFHDIARRIFGVGSDPLTAQGLLARVIDRLAPLVGEDPALVGFFTSFLRGGEVRESQARLRGYLWFRLLEALAREQPVVLLLTDLQWSEEESVDLMETLIVRAREESTPLSIIASALSTHHADRARRRIEYLSERFAAIATRPGLARRIELPPLGEDAVREMLGNLFPGSHLDEDHPWLVPALASQSGGNAFFLMQILRLLREARDESGEPLVSAEEGRWTLRPELTEERLGKMIPQAMDGAVRARIAALPLAVRKVLECAAVIGGEFGVRLLSVLVPDRETLETGLESLEEADLIRAQDEVGEQFRFINSVVPEIVMRIVAERSRRSLARLHREVAGALESVLGEVGLRRVALRYARHLLFAGKREASLHWHVIAAEGYVRRQLFLRGRTALRGASRLLEEGVVPEPGVLGTFYYLKGEVCRVTGDLSGALSAFDTAIRHLVGERGRGLLAGGFSRMGRVHESRGETEKAVHCYRIAAEIRRDNPGERAAALTDEGSVHLLEGADERARESFETARDLAVKTGDRSVLATALDRLASLALRRDDWDGAEALYRESFDLGERSSDRIAMARALNGLGGMAVRRGDLAKGAEYYQRALEMRREVGDREGVASVLSNLGVIHDRRGEHLLALRYYRRSAEALREIGSRGGLATVLNNIGVVNLGRGDLGIAIERFSHAVRIRREIGDDARTGTALANLAEAHALAGRTAEALLEIEEAEALLLSSGNESGRARALAVHAVILRRAGRLPEAADRLSQALRVEGRDPSVRAEVHLEAAEQHLLRGEPEAALRSAERGRELARAVGDRSGCAQALRVHAEALAAGGAGEEALSLLTRAEEQLRGKSGPELARVLLARGRILSEGDPVRGREVLMRARGLLDALEARGADLPEREEVDRQLSDVR